MKYQRQHTTSYTINNRVQTYKLKESRIQPEQRTTAIPADPYSHTREQVISTAHTKYINMGKQIPTDIPDVALDRAWMLSSFFCKNSSNLNRIQIFHTVCMQMSTWNTCSSIASACVRHGDGFRTTAQSRVLCATKNAYNAVYDSPGIVIKELRRACDITARSLHIIVENPVRPV